ncbi:MAG: twin-arginine translocase TatA/TatE family subunit [bacterium]|nr:twin-arginine translocase TatA/TatE family subunit [bacterium]
MFGIGLPEMIVIFAVALIVIGPDKLPDLARSLAKGLFELKRTLNEVRGNFSEEEEAINSVRDDLRKTAEDLRKKVMFDDLPARQLPPPDPEPEAEADRLEIARRSGPPIPLPEQDNQSEPQAVPLTAPSAATEAAAPEVIDLPHTEQPVSAPSETSATPKTSAKLEQDP